MSWKEIKLKEVCSFNRGLTYKKSDEAIISRNAILRSNNITLNSNTLNLDDIKYINDDILIDSSKKVVEESILICMANGSKSHLGKVAFIEKKIDYAFGGFMGLIIPNENLLGRFLFFNLITEDYKNFIKSLSDGANINNLKFSQLGEFQIPIPPLSEQQAIVEKLDAAFSLIDQAKANLEKNIQNAKELFQSKLNQIFTQKGEGWEERKLGEIGKVCMCKRIMKHQTDPVGEIPFYKIGTFGKAADAFISNEIYLDFKKKYSYPKKGEILISASGTIGRRVIFDGEAAYFQDSNIVWIQNDESKVLNNYLYHFYSVCDWNPSKGATISRLYNDDLRKISISFPTIDKQNEQIPIIERLSQQTNLLQEKYRQKLQNLEELRKSILEKAFKGELVQMSESQISSD